MKGMTSIPFTWMELLSWLYGRFFKDWKSWSHFKFSVLQ